MFICLTIFILMDYPIHHDTKVWNCPFCIIRICLAFLFCKMLYEVSLKIVLILANDEMPQLHRLMWNFNWGFAVCHCTWNEKGSNVSNKMFIFNEYNDLKSRDEISMRTVRLSG